MQRHESGGSPPRDHLQQLADDEGAVKDLQRDASGRRGRRAAGAWTLADAVQPPPPPLLCARPHLNL